MALKDRYGTAKDAPRPQTVLRALKPSAFVLIDLAALYAGHTQVKQDGEAQAPKLQKYVVGMLDAWVQLDTGWWGACRYRLELGLSQLVEQQHLVPSAVLQPADESVVRAAKARGELDT